MMNIAGFRFYLTFCAVLTFLYCTTARGQDPFDLLAYKDVYGRTHRVSGIREWSDKRKNIIGYFEMVAGPFPNKPRGNVNWKVLEKVDCGKYVRYKIIYDSEPGCMTPAYLLVPKVLGGGRSKAFGVLCLHQSTKKGADVVIGLGRKDDDAYARDLAERGFVCIAPYYPLREDYPCDLGTFGYQSGTMKAIWDNVRALDLLDSFSGIIKGRYGVIGHSLGGHNGIFTALFDQRIQVVVSSCGFDCMQQRPVKALRAWSTPRYMPQLFEYVKNTGTVPFDFPELVAAIAPRACFINAPRQDPCFDCLSVRQCVGAALGVYNLYDKGGFLVLKTPNGGHSFPKREREQAYLFLETFLKN